MSGLVEAGVVVGGEVLAGGLGMRDILSSYHG